MTLKADLLVRFVSMSASGSEASRWSGEVGTAMVVRWGLPAPFLCTAESVEALTPTLQVRTASLAGGRIEHNDGRARCFLCNSRKGHVPADGLPSAAAACRPTPNPLTSKPHQIGRFAENVCRIDVQGQTTNLESGLRIAPSAPICVRVRTSFWRFPARRWPVPGRDIADDADGCPATIRMSDRIASFENVPHS